MKLYNIHYLRGVFHLRISVWLENDTISPQFTLLGTNSEVKYSSYIIILFNYSISM